MLDEYKKDIRWSGSNQKRITRVLKNLQKNKSIGHKINKLHDEVFEEVDCLNCGNCCKTTGPLLTSKDINRIAKHKKISDSEMINTYLRIDEEGDFVFKSMPCPFLEDDNRCSIYEIRPGACRAFPHTDQKGQAAIANLTRKNVKICPAVSRIFQILSET